ncbi:MAG: hypothetical protein ACI4IJ_08705 [Acutalibacteraceae bacterium]
MEPKKYIVEKIEGEYAVLKNVDGEGEMFVAMALLPAETDIGTVLVYEMFQYRIDD